ncbi:1-phosphofructokinase [Carnobacteriaceae bacterium zg-ZUI240]|nr:1-phosphofructokinase [Carnobacteriaceae bacterium zg-ZUI240]
MIYTITFNPAVDLVVKVDDVQLGDLNRSTGEDYVAGGKGINMSVVLQRLGVENTAIAFLGGFSGEYIVQQLALDNIPVHKIAVEGITRINLKLKSKQETEINAQGAYVSAENMNTLITYLKDNLNDKDVVMLAGNKAPGMSKDDYVRVATVCQETGAKLVLDTTKELLTACLPYRPFLIKPNHHELGEIFNVAIQSVDDILTYVHQLQDMGATNVLVSRGGDGAVLVSEDNQVYAVNVPKGELVNSVGAGDSMLAGFLSEYMRTQSYADALKMGTATGSATAFSVGIATKEKIDSVLPQIKVEQLQ